MRLGVRRVAFWGAVAGVSLVSPFVLELAAERWPSSGLIRFLSIAHKGGQ